MRYVVTYDIADDRRREDVATLLSGYGPRVQLSVFECDLRTRREAAELQSTLRELIDRSRIRCACTRLTSARPGGSP
jgi:CRISPR-associated protein Cas2